MFCLFLQAVAHGYAHHKDRSTQLANSAMLGHKGLHDFDEIIFNDSDDPTLVEDIEEAKRMVEKSTRELHLKKEAIRKLNHALREIRRTTGRSQAVLPERDSRLGASPLAPAFSETEPELDGHSLPRFDSEIESELNVSPLSQTDSGIDRELFNLSPLSQTDSEIDPQMRERLENLLRKVDNSKKIAPEEIALKENSRSEYIASLLLGYPEGVTDFVNRSYDRGMENDLKRAAWIVSQVIPDKSSQKIAVAFLNSLLRERDLTP